EAEFYGQYSWCLNASPTIKEVVGHLSEELGKLDGLPECWQQAEVITNIFLLSCTLTDTIDDYLAGSRYDFSKVSRALPWARPTVRGVDRLLALARRFRTASLYHLQQRRDTWAEAVTEFLSVALVGRPDRKALLQQRDQLAKLVPVRLPPGLWNR